MHLKTEAIVSAALTLAQTAEAGDQT